MSKWLPINDEGTIEAIYSASRASILVRRIGYRSYEVATVDEFNDLADDGITVDDLETM